MERNKVQALEQQPGRPSTCTRNEAYLCYPLIRAGYGNSGVTMQRPPRIIAELPDELVEEWNLRTFA